MRGLRSILVIAISVGMACGVGVVPGAAGGPVILHFPDCAPVLQDCVDAAVSGSTIIIESDDAADAVVFIQKSLTLTSEAGTRRPVGTVVVTDNLLPGFGMNVTVRGLTIRAGLGVDYLEQDGNRALLDDLVVGTLSSVFSGVDVEVSRESAVTIRNSTIRRRSTENGSALTFVATHPSGTASLSVEGTRISLHGNAHGSSGIDLRLKGPGSVSADIRSTTIWDVASCDCAGAAGISIVPRGPIDADVDIAGVTIERSGAAGILQRNSISSGGHLDLRLFDTIISHTHGPAIDLDRGIPGSVSFRGGFNDRFKTGSPALDGFKAGPGNRTLDPRYLGRATGDLRLAAGSPLIDTGLVCSPAGVAGIDAAGRWRVKGRSVDLGAYERGAGSVTGVVRLGTNGGNTLDGTDGADILCGYGGVDRLSGLGGPDFLDGGTATDVVIGGLGADHILGGPNGDLVCGIDGVKGNDLIDGGPGTDAGSGDKGDTKLSVESPDSCAP